MGNIYTHDLVILGGGPAGMSAAIYAARANLKTQILESNITGGLVNSTYVVENFPSYPCVHGMELMQKMREHVESLNVPIEEVCEVESLQLTEAAKTIVTDSGTFVAKAIILATGRFPIPLETPTEAEQVHHCAICDGSPYVGKDVLVVGGGNSSFDESQYLLTMGVKHITIVEVMDRYFATKAAQEQLLSSPKVVGHLQTKVYDLMVENGVLKGAILENVQTGEKKTLAVDGIFVFLGQKPNNALFKDQVSLSEKGYILAGPDMSTNIPGVFGAGDINEKHYRQITTAVADGTIAALAAERYIRTC